MHLFIHLHIMDIAAALLDGPGSLATLSPQLNQQKDQLLVGATQQIPGRDIQVLWVV